MAYHVYICDDEPEILRYLSENVKNILQDCEIVFFLDGHSLLEKIDKCDILLLDIDMPDITGLDIAGRLSNMGKQPLLVFVTSHDELVYDSLKFHPFGFVRKSHMAEELAGLLTDCVKKLSVRKRHFCFQSAGAQRKLPLQDILYFEAEGNYLKLFVREGNFLHGDGAAAGFSKGTGKNSGEMFCHFRETLGNVEAALSGDGFVRIHKGFLVNQAAVQSLGVDEVVLWDGVRIPVGRSYAKDAKRRLMKWMLGT